MSSLSVSLSNWIAPRAAAMKAPWVWHTPLGLPVVPEVYSMIEMSSEAPLSISPSRKSGWLRSWMRPISCNSSRPISRVWV